VAQPAVSYLRAGGSFMQASGFGTVVGISQGGNDSAYLYGSAGNELLMSTSAYTYLRGAGFFLETSGFRGVTAYGMGGNDQAYLNGTLTAADTFVQSGSWAYLYGNACTATPSSTW
jgi:hypothetical protein